MPGPTPVAPPTSVLALRHGLLYRCASAVAGTVVRRLPEPERLVERAQRRAGRRTNGAAPPADPALAMLCRSLTDEARLNGFGRWAAGAVLEWQLTARLRSEAYAAEHPELARVELPAPLIITGLPRTASTFLHRWLAAIPGTRSLPLWELAMPAPPGGPASAADPRPARARRIAERLRSGATDAELAHFHAVHDSDVDDPEECLFLLARSFACAQFYGLLGRVPSYIAWVDAQADAGAIYAGYVRDLRILLAARGGARLVLKAPAHLRHLDALLAALPGARVVFLHRDPVAVVPSASSLVAMYHRQLSDHLDPHGIGRDVTETLFRDVTAGMRHADQHPDRVLHIAYDTLVADPEAVLERIWGFWIDAPLGDGMRRELVGWHRTRARRRPGGHRYAPEDFGLSAATLRARFAPYTDWYRERVAAATAAQPRSAR